VGLIRDDDAELRIVRRPAQQQIVVGDDELRLAQGSTPASEGTRRLCRALLPRTLIGPRRHRPPQQIPQRGKSEEQGLGQRSHLAMPTRARARGQRRVGEPILGEDARFAALGEDLSQAAPAGVVCAALDREGPQIGMTEHRGGRGNVFHQQLILEQLGACRDQDWLPDPGGSTHPAKRNRGGEIGQRFPDAGSAFEKQAAAFRQVADERASHADLPVPDPVLAEVTSSAGLVRERPGDGVLVEGHGLFRTGPDRHELYLGRLDTQRRSRIEQPKPRRIRRIALEGIPRDPVAAFTPVRPQRHPRQNPQGVEGVAQSPVPFLGLQHPAGEGFQAKIGCIGMGDGEQFLGIEVASLIEGRRHEVRQEVAFEARVVRHDGAPVESPGDGRGQARDPRSLGYVRVRQTGQSLHCARNRDVGSDQALEGRHRGDAGLRQDDPHLQDRSAAIPRESGGLQIDDRQRSGHPQKVRESAEVDPQIARVSFDRRERREGARRRFRL